MLVPLCVLSEDETQIRKGNLSAAISAHSQARQSFLPSYWRNTAKNVLVIGQTTSLSLEGSSIDFETLKFNLRFEELDRSGDPRKLRVQ